MSGAVDKLMFDGNTILLTISKEKDKHRYVYISGGMICSFLTNDNIFKYISNMGNSLTSHSRALSEESIHFLIPHFKYIKRDNINDNESSKAKKNLLIRLIIIFQIVEKII